MQLIFTERAHLMCPHMNFGIVLSVRHPYGETRILETLKFLSSAHPFLQALLEYEIDRNLYGYRITDSSKIGIRMKEQEIAGIDAPEIMDEYRRLTSYEWNLFEEGMLKVSVWPAGEETCFLLVFHHLLADGRAALGLAKELADCYAWGRIPELAEEKLISSAEDFPKESGMPLISRMLVNSANKIRAKTRECVSYREYYAAAGDFLKNDPVRHAVFRIDRKELNIIRNECRKHHVTVNDWLLARMMIEEHTEKVIMACDLRKQLACYNDGALGNYSTAFSVGIRTKERDPFILAGTLHKRVHRIMNHPRKLYLVLQCYANLDPAVLDAAWISCRGNYPSKAGKFIGSMFFGFDAAKGYSITNLGSVESGSMTEAFFIPPASPAIRKTQGILTVNGIMTVCSSER